MKRSLLVSALLVSTLQAADTFWDEIPLSPSTTLPSVVLDDYWNSEFQRVNREVAAAHNTPTARPRTSPMAKGRSPRCSAESCRTPA